MFFQQFTTPGLGCFSYSLGCPSAGTMAIIDPRRDISIYLEVAKKENLIITHIFDTHIHADHVTGSAELQKATGADIYIHESAPVQYLAKKVRAGDVFSFGSTELKVLHTPGHTPNSISLVVIDKLRSPKPSMILTGDLLFVGDVGRPDLPGDEILSEQVQNLYDSLYITLGGFSDDVEIYPAHGQGSLCGKSMSSKTHTTLGQERKNNWAYQCANFENFKKKILGNLPMRPQSFSHIINMNIEGAPLLPCELYANHALDCPTVAHKLSEGAVVVDTRDAVAFAGAHIPGSINIYSQGKQLPNWLGTVVSPKTPLILLLYDDSDYTNLIVELNRIGYQSLGYVKGGMTAWTHSGKKFDTLPLISAEELQRRLKMTNPPAIIDVSTPAEWQQNNIEGVTSIPLANLLAEDTCPSIPDNSVVMCLSGFRSSLAASLLQKRQCKNIHVLGGGLMAWKALQKNK